MAGWQQGRWVLGQPRLNRDAAFTVRERDALGLRGLLPWRTTSIEQQVALELEHLRRKPDDLERYIGLAALQDRNEVLFHRLLRDHLEELAPIVYTPTVGEACRRFSHIVRRPRGLWITPDDLERIPRLLANTGQPRVRLIVVTDNERILGLGDLGAGGIGIPIGKLALYSVGAGIHPRATVPVSLDCGTDNPDLLADPHYLGYPGRRLRGAAYDALVEAFVAAVEQVWPGALVQWEDFKQHNAIRLLEHYRHRIPSFNDDIQGTAAVVVAGILAALRRRGEPLRAQRMVLVGAGAAGIGIARLIEAALRREGAPAGSPRSVALLDSAGLVFQGRDRVDPDKQPFALEPAELASYRFPAASRYDLATTIRHIRPTILIGTSGQAGAFTEPAIRELSAHAPEPIVFPLSNPTANAEATPEQVLHWCQGRALVATGSPFPPVRVNGQARLIGQANNVFVFPGVGLGAIAARARPVTDEMFLVAATTLAELVPPERLAQGALYPRLADLRAVSEAVAVAVVREAVRAGVAGLPDGTDPAAAVAAIQWSPHYPDLIGDHRPPDRW
jgi:malic enzyme